MNNSAQAMKSEQPAEAGHPVPDKMSRTTRALLFFGAILRLVCFPFSSNGGGDALTRASMAANWVMHPNIHLDAFGPYPPLPFWLMAIPISLTHHVEFGARLVGLIFGVAALYYFWVCACELFGETASNYSLVVAVFYSLFVGYSTTSSSEGPYLFFLLGSLAYFFRYRKTGNLRVLAVSGAFMTCAAATRYEPWIIMFAIGLLLLWPLTGLFRKERLYPIFLFTALAGAWPAVFMVYCWRKFHDPVHYLTMQHAWTAQTGAFEHSASYILTFIPGVLLLTLSPFAIAAILYGLWRVRHLRGPVRDYIVIMVIFSGMQFYDLVSGGTWPAARYTITIGIFLALAAGRGLEEFLRGKSAQNRKLVSRAFVVLLAANFCLILALGQMQWRLTDKFRSISPILPFPLHVVQVANFLKPRIDTTQAILIDNNNCESGVIAREVGYPLPPGANEFLAS
ncbi:MAG: ArnT family glycosyltransferase, partial [Candidatus Acidiferrales bacterium]